MKKFFKWFVVFLVLVNAVILISGKTHLYRALLHNFANIDDNTIFYQRPIPNGTAEEWSISKKYNKHVVSSRFDSINKQFQTVAYLVIKDDSILHEAYWDGYGPDTISNSFSMAKSFVSILMGIAIDEGKITSVEDPVGKYLPEFSTGENSKLKIKHLLTMSSGLNWDESYSSLFSKTTEAYYTTDLRSFILKLQVVQEPGKEFKYQSCNTQLLSFIIEKATGKSLSEYASEKLWKNIGAKHPAEWSLDKKDGEEKAYCCFYSNARDFARFGKLYLNNGTWNGKQIVPENYVKASVTPANLKYEYRPAGCYGYSWWLIDNYKGHRIFYARGILGQYMVVIPDIKMIVVRLGKKRMDKKEGEYHVPDVFVYIDEALEMVK